MRPISRRGLLTGGAVILTAGGCSQPSQSHTSAPPAAPVPSATPTPTQTPSIGVRRFTFAELGIPIVAEWVSGPHSVLLLGETKSTIVPAAVTVVSSVLPSPWISTWSLSAGQTVLSQLIAVEQDPASEPAGSQVILASKAGTGLNASQFVLTVMTMDPKTQTGETGEYVVPMPADATDGRVELRGANMVNGVTVCTVIWSTGQGVASKDFAHRVAVSPKGEVLWNRTDNDNRNIGIGGPKEVLPVLRNESLPMTSGLVVFGVDDHYVGVDVTSGAEKYRATGPFSGGVAFQTATLFAVNAYGNGGYGSGVTMIRTADGTPFAVKNAATVASDPVSGLFAVGYTIVDSVSANDAPNTPGSPAIQVVDGSGTAQYTLKREQATALGQPKIAGAFDGRMIVAIKDGIRVLKMADGSAEPGFESIPPGVFRISNVPLACGKYAVMLGETNGYGETKLEYASSMVVSDQPLTWADLKVALSK
jgi:hypothetical protein